MNRESENYHEEQEISFAVKRYEEMIKKGRKIYFDVFQIEHIIDNFLEDGKSYPAFQAVEIGLTQHPGSIALMIKKAGILLNLGEIDQALHLVNSLLKIEDTNHELYLLEGSCFLLLGNESKAREAFNQSLKFAADDRAETIFNIGYAYEQNGSFDTAIEYFTEATYLDPKNEEAIYELAYCLEKVNKNQKSLEYYDKFLDIDPFSDSAWFNVGILHTKLENYEKSIEAYEYALAINDEFPNAWFNIAHSYMLLENFEKAIEAFVEYLKFEAENDEVLNLIGECYCSIQVYNKAEYYLNKCLKFNQVNARALHNMGLIKKVKGEHFTALELFRKAVNIEDENSLYHFSLADTASILKLTNEADYAFQKACELTPSELSYWLSYSKMLFDIGYVAKSIESLKLALEYHPDNPLLFYRLAAYQLESGYEDKAISILKKVLYLDFDNHNFLFESYSEAAHNKAVTKLIETYRPNKK